MKFIEGLSRICFGCEPLGGTDWGDIDVKEIEKAIRLACEKGLNFFDTASVYGLGLSEERLALILGSMRHEMAIATKGGLIWNQVKSKRAVVTKDSSPKSLVKQVHSSLKRLKIDSIPIYYIHWPDPNIPINSTFDTLRKLCDEQKIQRLGCSNFNYSQIEEASRVARIDFVQLPVNILNYSLQPRLVNLSKKLKFKIVAYNVLANGLLTGKYNINSKFPANDRRSKLPEFQGNKFKKLLKKVDDISKESNKLGMSMAQFSIKFLIKSSYIHHAIVGIKNSDQLNENMRFI